MLGITPLETHNFTCEFGQIIQAGVIPILLQCTQLTWIVFSAILSNKAYFLSCKSAQYMIFQMW